MSDPVAAAAVDGPDARLTRPARQLLGFARPAAVEPFGFAWLDERGRPDPDRPIHTWITARMTHVFALAHLLGEPGARDLAAHGVAALLGPSYDARDGGWFAAVGRDGVPCDERKQAYQHAFVLLAAGSAVAADVPGAGELWQRALPLVCERFLDPEGRVVEGYDRGFTAREDYSGANASMHMVEALLVAGDVAGREDLHRIALGMAQHLVHTVARGHGFLLPEHFTLDWRPLPDFHRDRPADPFRPYGCTPGHLLEWARLLLHLEASLPDPPQWLLPDAVALFDTAVRVGWEVDGAPGFVYTVDWDGRPVVRTRMHWVVAEAIAAAAALARRTGDRRFREWQAAWWDYAERHLVDETLGSWHHELDQSNRPARTTWQGKPDVYHAFQAIVLPALPLAPSAAVLLRERT